VLVISKARGKKDVQCDSAGCVVVTRILARSPPPGGGVNVVGDYTKTNATKGRRGVYMLFTQLLSGGFWG
jgi:hypothetical protein